MLQVATRPVHAAAVGTISLGGSAAGLGGFDLAHEERPCLHADQRGVGLDLALGAGGGARELLLWVVPASVRASEHGRETRTQGHKEARAQRARNVCKQQSSSSEVSCRLCNVSSGV